MENSHVYFLRYVNDDNIKTDLYCQSFSIDNDIIIAKNPFIQKLLTENVLNKTTIELAYKEECVEKEHWIDLINGIVLQKVEVKEWMSFTLNEIVNVFNQKVLEAYRTFATSASPTQPPQTRQKEKSVTKKLIELD